MIICSDFQKSPEGLVRYLTHATDEELFQEYFAVCSCRCSLCDAIERIGYFYSYIMPYLDFLECYLQQEICNRYCSLFSSMPVPGYPTISD